MQSLYSIEFHVFRWQLRCKIWRSFKDGVYDYLQCILRLLSEGSYYKDLTINQSLITAYTLQVILGSWQRWRTFQKMNK